MKSKYLPILFDLLEKRETKLDKQVYVIEIESLYTKAMFVCYSDKPYNRLISLKKNK